VLEIRGKGFMIGVRLAEDPSATIAALREAGLLVPAAGNNVFRLLPPLNATAAELAQSVEIIRGVLRAKA
jgi:acetylornithine aminotransferase/acetylornithine/N-succinyldiaminopimelate aminotransferase